MTTSDDAVTWIETEHPWVGLPNGEERFLKARLAAAIMLAMRAQGLSPDNAARKVGDDITPTDVSAITSGELREYSITQLIGMLNALDQDVAITVRPSANGSYGRTIVIDDALVEPNNVIAVGEAN